MENKLLCIFAACLTVFTSCNLKHGGKPRQPAADYIECRLFQIDDRNEDDPQSMCNDPRTIKMRFVAFNKTGKRQYLPMRTWGGSDSIYKSHIFLYIDNKEVDPWISADNNPCGIIENGGKRNVMLMITESMLKQVEIPVDIALTMLLLKLIHRFMDLRSFITA